jgi:hypothetical protein
MPTFLFKDIEIGKDATVVVASKTKILVADEIRILESPNSSSSPDATPLHDRPTSRHCLNRTAMGLWLLWCSPRVGSSVGATQEVATSQRPGPLRALGKSRELDPDLH